MKNYIRFQIIKMLLKIYSLFILMLDIVLLWFGICTAICSAVFRLFFPPLPKNLQGEVAMIIGAGRGVGRQLAIQLSQFGVKVACVDINSESSNATVRCSLQLYGTCRNYECDVTDKDAVVYTVNRIKSEMGDITMLFHCCGLPSPRALTQESPEIKAMMELSVISHFWLLDEILPCMQRAGKGHITILSSMAGLSTGTTCKTKIPLATAQFAVQGLAETLLTELKHTHSNLIITLVHIYPFIIEMEAAKDIRFRLPSYFGTISTAEAARQILTGVRRNYAEFSIPGYLFYIGHILRILPKKASLMLRELLDTGIDFA